MAMTQSMAVEHIRDGEDCVGQCLENLRRVQRNFPMFAGRLCDMVSQLQVARGELNSIANEIATSDLKKDMAGDKSEARGEVACH